MFVSGYCANAALTREVLNSTGDVLQPKAGPNLSLGLGFSICSWSCTIKCIVFNDHLFTHVTSTYIENKAQV